MRPRDLEKDDTVAFDGHVDLRGAHFRVSDVEVEDVGITEVVAVTLVCGCEPYKITGTTADARFTLETLDGDDEWEVWEPQINVVE